jgi:hypothetical protein
VVVGRVRRRFFRAGPGTQSRTEVVAENVVPFSHSAEAILTLTNARLAIIDAGPVIDGAFEEIQPPGP